MELYREIAAAGTGAIITAYSYISPEARSTGIQVGFATPEQRASQKEVLDAVPRRRRAPDPPAHARRHECLHAGKARGRGQAAGPLRRHESPQRNGNHGDHRGGSGKKIRNDFVDAAKAAQEMGFDGIQLHCAHGYLLSQFLDPNTNHRTDEFGGSAENRFRFAGECLSAIRQAVGKDYPILVKVNTNCAGEADEAYAQDILYFCRQFEALGADAIELSGYNWLGLGKKKRSPPSIWTGPYKSVRRSPSPDPGGRGPRP